MTSPEAVGQAVAGALDERVEVLDAYVFGSVGRGAAGAHSDVDVAVYLDAPTPDLVGSILADLMQALGRNDVDLVILNRAPPVLYHRVLRDGLRVLTRDPLATTGREGYALSRYCDYVPQLRKIAAATAKRREDGSFGR